MIVKKYEEVEKEQVNEGEPRVFRHRNTAGFMHHVPESAACFIYNKQDSGNASGIPHPCGRQRGRTRVRNSMAQPAETP